MTLSHLHVQPCPCPRWTVARNYARLLAAAADGTKADPPQTVALKAVGAIPYTNRANLDVMAHAQEYGTP